jgi:hypothetical protein
MQVGLPDGTYFKFSYNTCGQVYKIKNYAADSNFKCGSDAHNFSRRIVGKLLDGAGRVRAIAAEHPGSIGG